MIGDSTLVQPASGRPDLAANPRRWTHRRARPAARLPLGLGGEAFQPTQVSLPHGATLALYTDGLVKSRTRPLDDGMTALADALSMTLVPSRPALDTACAAVSSRLLEHGEDDITLVLARLSPA